MIEQLAKCDKIEGIGFLHGVDVDGIVMVNKASYTMQLNTI